MKKNPKLTLIFYATSLMLLYPSISSSWAKPPKTAKIVFTSTRDGNKEIYMMNADGSQQTRLTNDPADDFHPTWSPTGEQILFVSNRQGLPDLYLMEADGKSERRVFSKGARREDPTWSPDSKQIAYERWERDGLAIYIATLDTKGEERVAGGVDPAWAPYKNELAFIGTGDNRIAILTVHAPPPKKPIQGDRMFMKNPEWSPSGSELVFSGREWDVDRGEFKTEVLYTVNRDGTDVRQIVKRTKLEFLGPVWSPRRDALLYEQRVDGKKAGGKIVGGRFQLFKTALPAGKPKQLTQHGQNIQADWFDPDALPVSPEPQLLTTTWGQVKKEKQSKQ